MEAHKTGENCTTGRYVWLHSSSSISEAPDSVLRILRTRLVKSILEESVSSVTLALILCYISLRNGDVLCFL
jgi:hypothetical protein